VGQVGFVRPHPFDDLEGLVQGEMTEVGFLAQGIDHQHLDPLKAVPRLGREGVGIGDVRHGPDAESEHRQLVVDDGQRHHFHTGNVERIPVQIVQLHLGNARVRMGVEDVFELPPERLLHAGHGVDVHVPLLPEVEGADVIEPGHVVLVLMGEQDRIEGLDLVPQHLLTEVRPRIDDEGARALRSVLPVHLEQGARPGAVVPRIGGRAHRAIAGNDRDTL